MAMIASSSNHDVMRKRKIAVAVLYRNRIHKKIKRRFWVHPLNTTRLIDGEDLKIDRMYYSYPDKFFSYTRLTPSLFDNLLEKVRPFIEKEDTNYRKSVPAKTRLYITLRYLATGDHLRTIATNFSMGTSTVWTIVHDCLPAIYKALQGDYLKWPSVTEWDTIMDGFANTWNFPNCLGAIDGKHVVVEAPPKSGSLYLNYKGTFSIILLAVCDHDYKFTYVDVGAYGKQSDGGVLANSTLGKRLANGQHNIPDVRTLPNSAQSLNCCFVGDEAFPLRVYLMRPYNVKQLNRKTRIFNYRLSRARRTIENTFGIMAARFRIFRKPIDARPKQVENIVLAAICLHNYIKSEEALVDPVDRVYCPPGFTDTNDEDNGAWRREGNADGFMSFQRSSIAAQERKSKQMRDELADYFVTDGRVGWQDDHVDRN